MRKCALLFVALLYAGSVLGQGRYRKYDSIFYERLFSPTFATMMMPKGYLEVLVNNTLVSANQFWGDDRSKVDLSSRYSYNQTLLQTNFGVSSSSRLSVGADVYFIMGRQDADRTSSPLHVYSPGTEGNVYSASGVTGFAPRLKIIPFKRHPNFIFQTAYYIPLITDPTKKNFLGSSQYSWKNQGLYSIKISRKLMSFVQGGVDVYFKRSAGTSNQYYIPVNGYIYWLPGKHLFPFAAIGYSALIQKVNDTYQNYQNAISPTLGLQYQFSLRFNVTASVNEFLSARNNSNWKSFNLGFRGVF